MEQSYKWITSAIDSCTNDFQLRCCETLISLFETKYGNEGKSNVDELWNKMLAKSGQIACV